MANKTVHTETYVAKFIDEMGESFKVEVPYPDENKTDINFVQAAEEMRTSGAFKPDGASLTKVSGVSLIDTTKTYYDLDALNAD